jgi:hypothetical protein
MIRHLLVILAALICLVIIVTVTTSREKAEAYDKLHEAERICGNAMADASLGAERRTTREVCDRLLANIHKQIRATP